MALGSTDGLRLAGWIAWTQGRRSDGARGAEETLQDGFSICLARRWTTADPQFLREYFPKTFDRDPPDFRGPDAQARKFLRRESRSSTC